MLALPAHGALTRTAQAPGEVVGRSTRRCSFPAACTAVVLNATEAAVRHLRAAAFAAFRLVFLASRG